jgi:D-hydroxyproline dehydrogenase subunit gamma
MTTITIDGRTYTFPDGTTVAAAILSVGETVFRTSVKSEPRGPLCGMGICFECRVTIDGVPHQRSCTTLVRDGMEVVTGE